METEKRYFNIEELAAYLSFSKDYIYKLVRNKAIPHIPVNGKQTLRFPVHAINDWMDKQIVKPAKIEFHLPVFKTRRGPRHIVTGDGLVVASAPSIDENLL